MHCRIVGNRCAPGALTPYNFRRRQESEMAWALPLWCCQLGPEWGLNGLLGRRGQNTGRQSTRLDSTAGVLSMRTQESLNKAKSDHPCHTPDITA